MKFTIVCFFENDPKGFYDIVPDGHPDITADMRIEIGETSGLSLTEAKNKVKKMIKGERFDLQRNLDHIKGIKLHQFLSNIPGKYP